MTDGTLKPPQSALERVFERKVRLSTWALFFERLWPRLWIALGLLALLAGLSLVGVWPLLPEIAHKLVVAALVLAILAALVLAVRVPWPAREEAVRRIERRSGVAHRPATSYEDNLTANAGSAETNVLWQAHRERLARAVDRLKVGSPSPRADRFDPFALRAIALLALVPAAALVTGSFSDRISSAFRFGKPLAADNSRVDAWVTPPPYTGLPPVMLADGAQIAVKTEDGKPVAKPLIEVPDHSLVVVRGTGFKGEPVALEILSAGASEPTRVAADPPKSKSDATEVRYEIRTSARVRALAGSRELGAWTFDVTPDLPPTIALVGGLERTPKGSLKLAYKADDDFGVASAAAKLTQLRPKTETGVKAWAQPAPVKGPRLPLERPPELMLKLSRTGSKSVEGTSLLELGAHPWAGQRALLHLEATDVAGQTGKSEPVELVLPARRFTKPLARALIEQRRKLAEDSRNRPLVARSLNALVLEPEGFIPSTPVYLGLRALYHRLEHSKTRAAISQSINQMWALALKIEDGALSDAENSLKDVQDRLAKALEQGADDKDIQALMKELKEALNKYLQEMQKNASDEEQKGDQDQGPELSQQDIDKMLDELERSTKNGSREDAEKMLAELRELMDKMQAGQTKQGQENQKKNEQAMKDLKKLSDMSAKQRQLMDDTFKEQRKQNGENQGGSKQGDQQGGQQRPGQKGQQGPKGQPGPKGQAGKNENGQQGQAKPGEGQGQLRDRQSDIRKDLEQLKKDLAESGAADPEKLGQAEDAMRQAEQSLDKGDLDGATEQQSQALEQMRQQAQQMADKMAKESRQRLGRGDSPRDPLDRPQKSEGPDLGNSVKVPSAIDAQRAREILDELRKRSGQALRPPTELDYIERLLRRF